MQRHRVRRGGLNTPTGCILATGLLLLASCSGGESSDASGACSGAGDCSNGFVCLDGWCRQLCYSGASCADGLGCRDGFCQGCTSDEECGGSYACDVATGACESSCADDTDCAAAAYCSDASTCVELDLAGAPCARDRVCASNNCLDGTCCPAGCDTGCVADSCLVPQGMACSSTPECVTGLMCVDHVCCESTCDAPCATCAGATPGQCTAVRGASDDQCPTSCDAAGTCLSDLGAACTSPSTCASGWCVDDVCCAEECDEPCRSCALPGVPAGQCAAVANREFEDCRLTHGAARMCDARGECVEPSLFADINGARAPYALYQLASGAIVFWAELEDGAGLWSLRPGASKALLLKSFDPFTLRDAALNTEKTALYVITGGANPSSERDMWRTDGVSVVALGATSTIYPSSPVGAGDFMYFYGPPGEAYRELQRDIPGTSATPAFIDLDDVPSQASNPADLTVVGTDVYVTATLWNEGRELSRITTATPPGKYDIIVRPGPTGSAPALLTPLGSELYFVADDSAATSAGRVLYSYVPGRAGGPELKRVGAVCSAPCAGVIRALHAVPSARRLYLIGNAGGATPDRVYLAEGSALTELAGQSSVGSLDFLGHTSNNVIFGTSTQLYATPHSSPGPLQVLTDLPESVGFTYPRPIAGGAYLYFAGRTPAGDTELWRTDGTVTKSLDIWSGPVSSEIAFYGNYDGRLYFSAADPEHGRELWSCANTAGAASTLADVCQPIDLVPGAASSYVRKTSEVGSPHWLPSAIFTSGGVIISALRDSRAPFELLRVTGATRDTVASLGAVSRGVATSYPESLWPGRSAGEIAFVGNDNLFGDEVWAADARGVTLLGDLAEGQSDASIDRVIAVGTRWYVQTTYANPGPGLWVSDGAANGLRRFPDSTYALASVGQRLFVSCGSELCVSDDTGDPLAFADTADTPILAAVVRERLYFTTSWSAPHRLWVIDTTGSSATPLEIAGTFADVSSLLATPDRLYFVATDATLGLQAWATNCVPGGSCPELASCAALATAKGTCRATTLPATATELRLLGMFQGRLVTAAQEGATTAYVASDPATADSEAIAIDCLNASVCAGSPLPLVALGARAVFIASYAPFKYALWSTDGSTATMLMEDVDQMAELHGWAFVASADVSLPRDPQLFATDGTPEGTLPLGIAATRLLAHGGRLYFSSQGEPHVFP